MTASANRDLGSAARLLKAMANEHRLSILCLLALGERCVGELTASVGLGQSAMSQHLAKLRADGLVTTRRSAQTIYYSVASGEVVAVIETLRRLYGGRVPAPERTIEETLP